MALPFQMTSAELAGLRTDLVAYTLPDTCVIQSMSQVSDGAGGMVQTWAAAGTVPCRLDNKSGTRKPVATSLESFSEWVLTVPWNAPLSTNSRVTTGGHTYTVKAVSDDGSWSACIRAHVERSGA
jgi:SPP1 family predicted phage head-tail adaptor